MSIKPPYTEVSVKTADKGFYEGNSTTIAVVSKTIMVLLVVWALVWPGHAQKILDSFNWTLLQGFNSFYIISVGLFAFFLFIIAILPISGRKVMGKEGEPPEFSTFSWFAMMFGAGLGVGLMVFATAEPVGLWGSNPDIVSQQVAANSAESVRSGFRYTFLHYGFHAWAIYVITGLSLSYYAFTRDMPLTIRSALTPLFGKYINGILGDIVDILGVVATILGVSVTIGFGVSQFVDGLYAVSSMDWLMNVSGGEAPAPSTIGLLVALFIIMGMSILSAVSGVGRGIKYLSNLNLVLSVILLTVFAVFGSFAFAITEYGKSFIDYILHFIPLSFEAYSVGNIEDFTAAIPAEAAALGDASVQSLYSGATNAWGSFDGFASKLEGEAAALSDATKQAVYKAGTEGRLFGWQSGWTTFYWAWWIAFSPFVGLFLARISRGRTVRTFIIGCVLAPALVCFAWMTILGGTAIDLELRQVADPSIVAASNTSKLFVNLQNILDPGFYKIMTVMCVVLILTFLVTSADSGILVMNTIISGGEQNTGIKHRIIWGVILTLVIASLLIAGNIGSSGNPFDALQDAMIIGALPFTMVMVLMMIALGKALYRDSLRDRHNN